MKKISIILVAILFTNMIPMDSFGHPKNLTTSSSIYNDTIDNIIKTVNISELRRCISINDEALCTSNIKPLSIKIADYITVKEAGFNFSKEATDYPLEMTVLGIFQLLKEKNYPAEKDNGELMRNTGNFDCFASALSGLLGISEINALYRDFSHGVSASTVFRTMKTMLRRVAGSITIAWTVVELAICLFD